MWRGRDWMGRVSIEGRKGQRKKVRSCASRLVSDAGDNEWMDLLLSLTGGEIGEASERELWAAH